MITITRTLIAVGEIKLYSSCTRFYDEQVNAHLGFVRPDFAIKLSFMHTVTKDKFKINPYNIFSVVRNFETAVMWFYDKDKRDMFYIDEMGILQFNYDYSNVSVLISSPDGEHIELRPTVDYTGIERGNEGIAMYINTTDTQTVMKREELEAIYVLLKEFSFQAESTLLLYELDSAIAKYKASGGKINEHAEGQYNSIR